jgi:predicted RNase H-like HicB family nuclease
MMREEWDNQMVICDGLEDYLYERIIDAYKMGMSVIEISRIIGRRADHVHDLLRRAGRIKAIERRGSRSLFSLDPLLAKEFRAISYSFARWCAGWKFDAGSAARAIRLPHDVNDPDQYVAALRRDFPECYCKLNDMPPSHLTSLVTEDEHPSVEISWDEERNYYLARVVEYPEIEESGRTLTKAFKRMADSYRIKQIDEAITLYENVLETNGKVSAPCFC